MSALALRFGKDKHKWALCGLLHDIDYEETKGSPDQHSLIGAKMLLDLGVDQEICQAVKVHNHMHKILPKTLIEKALFVADPLSGLIVACALVSPSRKLSDIDVDFVLRRFRERAFARGVDRGIIVKCEEYLGLSLEEFVSIGLEAMQKISSDLEL